MTADELGEAAYLAFCRSVENQARRSGTPPPDWHRIGRRRRDGWIAAAKAVRIILREERLASPEVHHIAKGLTP